MTADKDKRRAISREAARKRRKVESDVFADLSRLLPLQPSVRDALDKPSVIRLTLSYIRLNALLKGNSWTAAVDGQLKEIYEDKSDSCKKEETIMYLRILEGFVMVVSTHGDMIYLSDNVSRFMGLTQIDLMGHNIFEFTHPCDHEEIRTLLRLGPDDLRGGAKRDFIMRIKSALTQRGRSANLKSATWKVLHCEGRAMVSVAPATVSCLLLTCQPLPLSHTLLSKHTFSSQHSMDMKFTYCDHRVTELLGYSPEELLGRSIYDLCHALDMSCLTKNHVNLLLKSQSVSGRYRILVRGGGYVWAESHSAVIPSIRPSRWRAAVTQPLCILCVTYILSEVEQPFLQLSVDQIVQRFII